MPDQPSETKKAAIKIALGAALGGALGIAAAKQASKREALTPQPPSPYCPEGARKGGPEGDTPNGIPRYSHRVPPPAPGGGQGVGSSPDHPDWKALPAAHLPRPTYWPVVLALGIVFLAWGIVTTLAITVIGLGLLALALGGWIGELRHGHG